MVGKKQMKARSEACAGGVVLRNADAGFEVALAEELDRISGAGNTRLAKGHIESGESAEAAALREVREEIGVVASILAPLGSVDYTYVDGDFEVAKVVHFFLMEAVSDEELPLDGEMQRVYWCPIEAAGDRLTFDTERRVVERARSHLAGSASD